MDSGWAAVIGSIVGGMGTFGATWLNAYLARKQPDPADETAKRLLKEMLETEGFHWRNLDSLSNVIGRPESETRELLLAIGARGSETNPKIWGLISRNPLPTRGSTIKDPTLAY
tara:strand:+ start:714 stop:1055 length:342 start_codon:yes stop_codon:yes gene_type:complete